MNPTDMIANIRDLAVLLHRGNTSAAELIIQDVAGHLKTVMQSGASPDDIDIRRAQQTLFAIDDVRILMTQGDFEGAAEAARDAAREWRQEPAVRPVESKSKRPSRRSRS